jgi:hypothetical protein
MLPPEYTEEFEVRHAPFGRPHVVLLGAGASYAAFPNGDKNGHKLPLLKDFVEVIGLHDLKRETKGSGIFFVTVRAENLSGPSGFLDA